MKYLLSLVLLVLLLSSCGGTTSKPDPTKSTWNTAKWNEATWEK